jgi:hypothetical protein
LPITHAGAWKALRRIRSLPARAKYGFVRATTVAFALAAILFPAGLAAAKSQDAEGSLANGIRAVRVAHPPRLDGMFDDPLWQQAVPVSNFRQREPVEGNPPSESTEVRLLYDSHHIYVGVFCYDANPKAIVATQLRRDLDMSLDDNFAIVIDPTGSRRNGYIFEVNALGTQLDGEVIEEQAPNGTNEIVDPSWDGLWISAAHINDRGWTATISIPFSTLNFEAGSSATWGINFRRFIRRKNEEVLWSAFRRQAGLWKVSEAGQVGGLRDIASGRLLIVKPYVLGGFTQSSGQSTTIQHTGGVDAKYGIRPNLLATLTVNTDFADADVDQQQFNLTPYPLFFPEKRRFFLEHADVFQFLTWNSDLLFFSRQIGIDAATGQEVPIDAGGKLAGQLGGFDLGIMDVKTRSQGAIPDANYSVARVKRPMFGDSYIGAIFVDKESGDPIDSYNRTAGVDAKFVLFKDLNIRGFYARNWSPLVQGDDYTAGARVTYQNHWMNLYAGHGTIRPNYNPEVGFVARTDDNPTLAELNLTPRPNLRGIRELQFDSFLDHDPNTAGMPQFQEWTESFRILFQNGALTDNQAVDSYYQRLNQPFNIYKDVFIPAGGYHFTRHQVSYMSSGDRRITFLASERWGDYYTGRLNELTFNTQYRPGEHLALALNNTWNSFRLPQANFDVVLSGLQVSYAFNRFVNLTTFVQSNTANNEAVSANIRLRYTYRPDSDLYVIYNVGSAFQSLTAQNLMQLRQSRFAVKLTYAWSR